jgi:uncharacterized protein DUF4038/uncharacterized protein DUF5060/collagenase-like protein with putative collagen-binding domain
MKHSAERNHATEIAFTARATYDDPYNDVDVDAVMTRPDGNTERVPLFWAGGDTWKLRFAGEEEGEHVYETVCSNPDDEGLHGQTGSITVEPYTGDNPLLQHGRLRVAADQHHFEHADGTPFFWLGDTWWMGLTKRCDWPEGFQRLATDRVEKGFNVVQIIAGPLPDMDAWDPRGRNEAGHPFEDGFARVNVAYFELADTKIAHLVESGLMPCIVGMWGYYLPQIGVDRIKRFWRYLVARYGAYPVTWCLCGEGTMPYYLSENKEAEAAQQKTGWTEVMRSVREVDGYNNLITIHPCHLGRDMVEDPSLMDFEMLQTGHSDLESVPNVMQSVIKSVPREPLMPVINSEVNYEGILGRAWQNVQRLCFYHTALNGAAGHTYGANGIWQMSREDEPYGKSPHGRSWGNTSWTEAMHLPGGRQVALGGTFMRRFPWREFEPHPEWVEPAPDPTNAYSTAATGIPGKLRIIYVPMLWDPPTIQALEPEVRYHAYYFNPCTGEQEAIGEVQPNDDCTWTPPETPSAVHDWLIVLEAS